MITRDHSDIIAQVKTISIFPKINGNSILSEEIKINHICLAGKICILNLPSFTIESVINTSGPITLDFSSFLDINKNHCFSVFAEDGLTKGLSLTRIGSDNILYIYHPSNNGTGNWDISTVEERIVHPFTLILSQNFYY